jgi:hypothetical protein
MKNKLQKIEQMMGIIVSRSLLLSRELAMDFLGVPQFGNLSQAKDDTCFLHPLPHQLCNYSLLIVNF